MAFDIAVVGLYIVDILGRPITDIPAGGAVDFIEEIRLTVAGTAGGTAVDCAKLGMATLAVGAVGDDEKAGFLLSTLAQHGVDISRMQKVAGIPTSSTILCIRPNGERPAMHARGASDYLFVRPEDVPEVFQAPIVHLGGTGLLRAMDGAPSADFLRHAQSQGCITSFDLVGARRETAELVDAVLPYVDYFMPSIEEASILSGESGQDDIIRHFLDRGVKTCVLTMGEEGALIASREQRIHIPAYDVPVVDTTGCGDAFSAGFLTAIRKGDDIEQAGRFGAAAAAMVATGLGSDAGIVGFEETRQAMNTLPIKH
ncbi:MAG: sugar kinase [Thermaerobacter sp.]|nr:sugar kinase [Thermaerobacter sp.]